MQVSHRASLPPLGGSWAPRGSLLSVGPVERRSGHAGGWFGLARTPSLGGTGCSHPYKEKQSLRCSVRFSSQATPPPSAPSQRPVKGVAGVHRTRVAGKEQICNSMDRVALSKHEGPSVPF